MGDHSRSFNGDNGEWAFPSGKELGPLLKAKREEKGLTYGQISEQIKVRQGYLEALENEEWDRLPSPVFVKGFVRSYARVLGLSEGEMAALYEEISPPPGPLPRPIQAPPPRKWGIFYLVLVLMVLAAGIWAYRWIVQSDVKETPIRLEHHIDPAEKPSDSRPTGEREPARSMDTDDKKGQALLVAPPESKAPGQAEPTPGVLPQVEKGVVSLTSEAPVEVNRPAPERDEASGEDVPPLVLKAFVREKTWIRVIIDGQKIRESIFNPETQLEWRAHKGFELLVGNAGGIDLELNGEELGSPGKRGQVVKLKLPSTEETNASGE